MRAALRAPHAVRVAGEMTEEAVAAAGTRVPRRLRDRAQVGPHHVAAPGDLKVGEHEEPSGAEEREDEPVRHDPPDVERVEQAGGNEAADGKADLGGYESPEATLAKAEAEGPPPGDGPRPLRMDLAKLRVGVVAQVDAWYVHG